MVRVGVPGDEENLERFVVGKVVECRRHPDADKLSVCVVDVGDDELRTIVCGAPNVATGQTVAVVLPGGVMPDGTVIRDAKLRGVQSAGMILSEAELDLAAKSPGIMVLPDSWVAGELLADYFALSDWVLEVEVTPNRPDCLSIRGLAREIAAITEAPFAEDVGFRHPWGSRPVDEDVAIEVLDPDLCPRYAGRVIRGVKIEESPLWLKARIVHAGMRPVNNVVDITNYVLWTLGQPLHAFDLRTIRGGRIVVRRANPGEELTTLDNEHRVLTDQMLVIADAERASVVAGIMGGLDSEVTNSTTDILLEGATFAGPSIMRTSGALGLRSEASTRYEKGLDPNMVPPALDMACSLFVEICGGEVSIGTIDVRVPLPMEKTVKLRPGRIEHILGASVPTAEVAAILARLGCNVGECGEDILVTVPTFRGDLEREIDLVEEVARIHGLDQIPSTLPARREGRGGLDRGQNAQRKVEDLLVGAGLTQVINYSFADDRWPEKLRLDLKDPRRQMVKVTNPLSNEQAFMRTLLLPGLLETARQNVFVREDRVRIFEAGRVYEPGEDVLPRESMRVAVLVIGQWDDPSWLRSGATVDYFLIKGLVERLAAGLHCRLDYAPADESFLHPGKSAALKDQEGHTLGWLGEVHPLVLQAYDLQGSAVAAEIRMRELTEVSGAMGAFRDLIAYPVVEQDIALVVDADMPAAEVVGQLRDAAGELLKDVAVFDVYEGSQIPPGKKSLALRLSFRAHDRTLSDTEVTEIRDRMLAQVAEALGARLRA